MTYKVRKTPTGFEVIGDWGELAIFDNNLKITYHNFRYNRPIVDKMTLAIIECIGKLR